MLTFPNAKINLGLNITEKRSDGYHNIESCFYPIPLKDALEIVPSKKLEFETTGLPIPGDYEHNLVLKAYRQIKNQYDIPEVKIVLHKHIPMGAGLGGGSADGAFMLSLLDEYFELNIPKSILEDLALNLGSDCPFFIDNKPKVVTGRGEIFEDTSLDLSGFCLGLVFPGIHISTAEAYSAISPKSTEISIQNIIERHEISEWNNLLTNDFEKAIFSKYPKLQKTKDELYENGAIYASMTGTGSTLFGLFKKRSDMQSIPVDQMLAL